MKLKNTSDNHLTIVCAHQDNQNKIDTLYQLLIKLKKIPNNDICFCTHYSDIPKELIELCDYVVYSKENPILNWDIIDDFTQTFGCKVEFSSDQQVLYYQPYHGYAHFLSMIDGIVYGANLKYTTFTICNFDVVDECIRRLEDDIRQVRTRQKDGVYFVYDQKYLNTEFFTFNLDIAKEICKYRKYDVFSANFETMMLENVMTDIISRNDFNIEINFHEIEDDSLGTYNFTLRPPDLENNVNDKYFIPFYNEWIDGFNCSFYYIPVSHKMKKYICRVNQSNGNFKGEILIDGEPICTQYESTGEIQLLKNYPCNMKVIVNGELKANIYLHDERQFGKFKTSEDETSTSKDSIII
jgi:hypothetical protein